MINKNDRMIGESSTFLEVLEHISLVAPLDKPVLVVGERGTGKELAAERVHYLSERWGQPFLKLNCASLSDTLLDSELFGHEAGAFSGATRQHQGYFERADGGTLFLDELATTSTRVQEKILRLIEYGELTRVGSNKTIIIDVRLVAATNEDLPLLVEQGRFRADLLDRLAFDVINLPPLRYRQEDIFILAEHFAMGMIKELHRDYFPGFSKTALKMLHSYHWPGNIRELKNAIERSVYRQASPDSLIGELIINPFQNVYRDDSNKKFTESSVNSGQANTVNALADFVESQLSFKAFFDSNEKILIESALKKCKFNQRTTAKLLGMTYHQLRGQLKKHSISREMK